MDEIISLLAQCGIELVPSFDSEIQTNESGWVHSYTIDGDDGMPCLFVVHYCGKDGKEKNWTFGPGGSGAEWDAQYSQANLNAQDVIRVHKESVALSLLPPPPAAPTLFDLPGPMDFERPAIRTNKKGDEIPPPQQHVADIMLAGFGENFMRDGEDPFFWQDTHWQGRNASNFHHYLCSTAQFLRMGEAKASELEAIAKLFMHRAPSLRDNQTFYQQNPYLANFLDGTLEVVKGARGTYTKRFREHRREDLLTWVLPYKYKDARPANPVFNEWLMKAFMDDPDGEGKMRALKQIGGSCLISLFPRLNLLLGVGGTGKSTFAKLCMKFLQAQNFSSVPPHLLQGFHVEALIGKQANIVTDIGKSPVPEDFIKLIEDNLPMMVNRKGRAVVQARLPAVHVFCTNALPRGIDGETNAMDRRVTIVEFIKSMLGEDGVAYTRDYEEVIMEGGPGAILDFFEDGLDDLLACGGLYANPRSGVEKLRVWKDSESFTAQVLDALNHMELGQENDPLIIDGNAKILRSKLSESICTLAGRNLSNLHLNRIFAELDARGFKTVILKGRRYVSGIRGGGSMFGGPGV